MGTHCLYSTVILKLSLLLVPANLPAIMFKVFVVVLALAVAVAVSLPVEEHSGEYKVDDDRFEVEESDQDAAVHNSHHQYVQKDGTIVGEYAVLGADGKTLEIVKYTAGLGGYKAKVIHTDDLSVFD